MKHSFLSSKVLSIVFLILLPFYQGMSQDSQISANPHRRKPEIIILSGQTLHVSTIREGRKIGYVTTGHKYNEGTIKRISKDTIFIGKTFVRMQDLILITNPDIIGPESLKHPESFSGMVIYKNDSTKWRIYYPPDSAYTSFWNYNKAFRDYRDGIRKDHRQRNFRPVQNNYLQLNLTRLLNLDVALTYERKLSGSISLNTELGYKFATGYGPGFFDAFFAFSQSGPSLIIGPKFYFNKKFYFTPLLHLKYLEIHGADFKEPFSAGNPTLMDQFETLTGVSLRLGIMAHAGACWFDIYIGAGLKYTSAYQVMYYYYYEDSQHYFNNNREPSLQNVYNWYPIFNLGIKIGMGF